MILTVGVRVGAYGQVVDIGAGFAIHTGWAAVVLVALGAIAAHRGPVVAVSDELGLGMVPLHAVSRAFRDLAGLVHQRFAAAADEVHVVIAGLPMTLKGQGRP